jgi:antitoxin VapB
MSWSSWVCRRRDRQQKTPSKPAGFGWISQAFSLSSAAIRIPQSEGFFRHEPGEAADHAVIMGEMAGGVKKAGQTLIRALRYCIYIIVYTSRRQQMATAKVFRSGNSQAVRLPKQFRVASKEVEIFRRGDEIVLREKGKGLARAFDILANLPDDILAEVRRDTPPQKRDGL